MSKLCRRGHPITEANSYVTPDGWTACRVCRRDREREGKGRPGAYVAPPKAARHWCAQCDRNVLLAEARACQSRFCAVASNQDRADRITAELTPRGRDAPQQQGA